MTSNCGGYNSTSGRFESQNLWVFHDFPSWEDQPHWLLTGWFEPPTSLTRPRCESSTQVVDLRPNPSAGVPFTNALALWHCWVSVEKMCFFRGAKNRLNNCLTLFDYFPKGEWPCEYVIVQHSACTRKPFSIWAHPTIFDWAHVLRVVCTTGDLGTATPSWPERSIGWWTREPFQYAHCQ